MLKSAFQRASQACQKISPFQKSETGVAAVEFALVVPVMLVLYMGTIEVGQIISVNKNISTVASSLGDLVAQHGSSIAATTLDDYFTASNVIMQPFDPDEVSQRITSVYVDEDGNTNVEWSVSYNGASLKPIDSSFTLPSHVIALALEGYVIVSESEMSYTPWGGYVLEEEYRMQKVFYNFPRFGTEIELVGSSTAGSTAS